MELKLYQNKSDKLEVTKSIDLIDTKSCELKEDTSIITPTFLLSGGVDDYADVNYAYVADFLRYYYIENVTSAGNGMVYISCRVDVLMSFASAIRNNYAIIARNENWFNLYMDDGAFTAYANSIVQTKEFPDGFASPCFVLAVSGIT